MNCKNCGYEITDTDVCPACGSKNEEKAKKKALVPVIAFILVIIMGAAVFLVRHYSERIGLEKALETDVWFTVVGENEFVVIKFEDGQFASSRITDAESDADVEKFSYKAVSDEQFKIEDTVYSVRFDDEGMEVSPGIADRKAKSELWYHIEE